MCVWVEPVSAQGRVVDLVAESGRLRVQLERANAEISTLKRRGPGVRNDYRLRRRQADAEELARRLTTVEAELRNLRAGRPGPSPVLDAPGPAEAPASLEARADLLLDEARRLTAQAGGLARAAGELRARQTLQRRAGQIERDPFASMDASKRFMLLQAAASPTRPNNERASQPPASGPVGASGVPPTARPVPPASGTSPAGGSGAAPVTTFGTESGTGAAPATTRALLDPAALAELRRSQPSTGKPLAEVERLEQAAAALETRARALEAEAGSLRRRAAER
jgi:hypothetical protein